MYGTYYTGGSYCKNRSAHSKSPLFIRRRVFPANENKRSIWNWSGLMGRCTAHSWDGRTWLGEEIANRLALQSLSSTPSPHRWAPAHLALTKFSPFWKGQPKGPHEGYPFRVFQGHYNHWLWVRKGFSQTKRLFKKILNNRPLKLRAICAISSVRNNLYSVWQRVAVGAMLGSNFLKTDFQRHPQSCRVSEALWYYITSSLNYQSPFVLWLQQPSRGPLAHDGIIAGEGED